MRNNGLKLGVQSLIFSINKLCHNGIKIITHQRKSLNKSLKNNQPIPVLESIIYCYQSMKLIISYYSIN